MLSPRISRPLAAALFFSLMCGVAKAQAAASAPPL